MSRSIPHPPHRRPARRPTQAEPGEYYEFYDRRGHLLEREPVLVEEAQEADPSYVGHYGGTHPEHRPWLSGEVILPPERRRTRASSRDTEQPPTYSSAHTRAAAPAQQTQSTRSLPADLDSDHDAAREARRTIALREGHRLRFSLRWLLVGVLLLLVMLTGWLLFTVVGSWWQSVQDGWTYGLPRTYQVDQYVGQQDSPSAPDHFLALNLHGLIEIVQINPQHPEQDHIYTITSVSDEREPVTLRFADTTGDGKLDLLVAVGDSNPYTVVLRNTGKAFAPQQSLAPQH